MEKRSEGAANGEKAPEPLELQKRKTQEGCGGSRETAGVRASQGKVCIRAADMPPKMQMRAFRRAQELLAGMTKLESKRLAQTLKKVLLPWLPNSTCSDPHPLRTHKALMPMLAFPMFPSWKIYLHFAYNEEQQVLVFQELYLIDLIGNLTAPST